MRDENEIATQPVANCDRFKSLEHSSNYPHAFSEMETDSIIVLKSKKELL